MPLAFYIFAGDDKSGFSVVDELSGVASIRRNNGTSGGQSFHDYVGRSFGIRSVSHQPGTGDQIGMSAR